MQRIDNLIRMFRNSRFGRGFEQFFDITPEVQKGVYHGEFTVKSVEPPGPDFKLGRVVEAETGKVGWLRRMEEESTNTRQR